MRPILFKIFGQNVYGYGMMIALGILSAVLLVNYRAGKRGYEEDYILNMAIIAIVVGVIGGKLLYIIVDLKSYINNPSSLISSFGSGFVIFGAIIGGAVGVILYCKKRKWNVLDVLDLVIPSVALAQGFGRIGCFLAGCCYGAPTNLKIGVEFKDSFFAPSGVKLQPTQIYSSVFDFSLAVFLLLYSKKQKNRGRIFSMYLIVYSIGRFFVEFLRGDERGSVGALSTSQFISIFTLIIGIFLFNINRIRKQNSLLIANAANEDLDFQNKDK